MKNKSSIITKTTKALAIVAAAAAIAMPATPTKENASESSLLPTGTFTEAKSIASWSGFWTWNPAARQWTWTWVWTWDAKGWATS